MKGLTIATTGCFDLFHIGHKHILDIALRNCFEGKLYIFINSDKSVTRLKGPGRPKEDLIARAGKVEKYVNEWCQKHNEYPSVRVIVFNTEEELEEKIDFYSPDMIVKGDDRPDTREIVGSGKWPILIVPRLKDKDGIVYSTTSLIGKK
jgi:D-beta-D-heptose 7-phosphate kinase/D-beta-D-heptose 1-phosphate adenosyltransferase